VDDMTFSRTGTGRPAGTSRRASKGTA
jgi:hypothetical protein